MDENNTPGYVRGGGLTNGGGKALNSHIVLGGLQGTEYYLAGLGRDGRVVFMIRGDRAGGERPGAGAGK